MKRIVFLLLFISFKIFGQSPKMEVVAATNENVDGVVVNLKSTNSQHTYAIKAINNSTFGSAAGIYGEASGSGSSGVLGRSDNGVGVLGESKNALGVYGGSENGTGLQAYSRDGIAAYFSSPNGHALITGDGKIGINTATPKYQMTFKSQVGDKISFWGGEASNVSPHYGIGIQGGTLQFFVPTASDNHVFGVGRSGDFSEKFRITGNGNLINRGTDAGYRFFDRTSGTKSFQWYSNNGNAYLFRHHTTAGNVLTVLENGNVGIGTDTPQTQLHVKGGDVRIDAIAVANRNLPLYVDGAGTISTYIPVNFAAKIGTNSIPISNSISITIPFNTEDYDTGNAYDSGTYEFSCPSSGYYHFDCSVTLGVVNNTGGSSEFEVYMKVDNTVVRTVYDQITVGSYKTLSFSTDLNLTAGQKVKVLAWQYSGGSLSIIGNSFSYFSGHLINKL